MKRREFVRISGVVAAAWLSPARAQQPATPVIGFLNSGSPDGYAQLVAAVRQGLNEIGYVEGQNVAIEFRWAQAQDDRLSALATELVRRPVAVIAGLNSTAAARAAKAATTTLPIVFVIGAKPVEVGLVASLNRPGGNLTGVSFLGNMLVPKRLELLRELVPTADTIAFLVNPINPNADADTKNAQAAAHAIGRTLFVLNATSERDLETAFAKLAKQRAHALLVNVDPLFISHRGQIILLAARHAIPTIYDRREFVEAVVLRISGSSLTDVYRKAGIYTGRILKGTKPADLPILQPTKFEMVINLKTAKALGVTIPQSILLRADQVIE